MSFWDGGFSGVAAGVGGLASGISNFFGNQSAMAFSKEQFEWQKYLAANQLQLRVKDAQKAGLHPMAALGLASTSFSPVGVSQSPYDFSFLGQMGQSADYAAAKAKDKEEQAEALALSKENARLQNENLQLQNQGLQQDNEFNQWRMNAAMSGALQQGLKSPANASVNGRNSSLISGQDDSLISSNTFSADTGPLMSLSRMGDVLVAHVDPNKSDALTEDFLKNAATQFIFNDSALKGRYGLEVAKHFTPSEQKALRNGDAYLAVIPGVGWRFVWDKKFRPKYSRDKREVSGKLNRY